MLLLAFPCAAPGLLLANSLLTLAGERLPTLPGPWRSLPLREAPCSLLGGVLRLVAVAKEVFEVKEEEDRPRGDASEVDTTLGWTTRGAGSGSLKRSSTEPVFAVPLLLEVLAFAGCERRGLLLVISTEEVERSSLPPPPLSNDVSGLLEVRSTTSARHRGTFIAARCWWWSAEWNNRA